MYLYTLELQNYENLVYFDQIFNNIINIIKFIFSDTDINIIFNFIIYYLLRVTSDKYNTHVFTDYQNINCVKKIIYKFTQNYEKYADIHILDLSSLFIPDYNLLLNIFVCLKNIGITITELQLDNTEYNTKYINLITKDLIDNLTDNINITSISIKQINDDRNIEIKKMFNGTQFNETQEFSGMYIRKKLPNKI